MLIAIFIMLYLIIGIIAGVGCYVFVFDNGDDEMSDVTSVFAGILWPLAISLGLIGYGIAKFSKLIYRAMMHIKREGFRYYKGDLPKCCGQCKYSSYTNDYTAHSKCSLHKTVSYDSTETPCQNFKLNPWWRFTIRIDNK